MADEKEGCSENPESWEINSELSQHPQMRETFSNVELKYKRLFDSAGEMHFITSRKGKILDINQAGVDLFRFATKEAMLALDTVGILFCNPEEGKVFQRRIEAEGFIKDFEVGMRRCDGTFFTASITAGLWFEEDGAISCEGVLRDITEIKQLQEACLEAEKANRELTESERRIRDLNTDILNMLMIMSHDIRGPLVSIAATLKLLMRGSFGHMDESVINTVQELLARVRHLIGIAEDCLGRAHSLEGTARADREMVDLRQDIIDPVLDEVSNEIELHRITIDNRLGAIPAGCIPISVRMMWLKAVFRNLFKNAIKYGGKCCNIAFGFEDHGGFYRLNVYNSGNPIPEEFRDRLFTKFTQIDVGAEKKDGFGMGLYLIREIVRKHGGDIWYEAKRDGSDFVLILAKEPQ